MRSDPVFQTVQPPTGGRRTFCPKLLGAVAVLALMLLVPAEIQAQPFDEYQVKAVFLFNLTHFVTWPQNSFKSPDAPFIIGIFGPDPFNASLDQVLQGERYGSHPIVLKRLTSMTALAKTTCHLLYIAAAALPRWPEIRHALRRAPVLTVADTPTFCRQSGLVSLLTEQAHIRVAINLAEARQRQLEVSSKLLSVASICSN
jgi:YfiR/HmsC-like